MPIIKSAKKAARQAEKRTAHNQQIKKDIKNAIKAFRATPTGELFAKAQSELDKAVKKGLLKKNTASRRKASLANIAKAAKVTPKKSATKTTSDSATKNTKTAKTSAATKATTKKTTTTKKVADKKPESKAKVAKKTA